MKKAKNLEQLLTRLRDRQDALKMRFGVRDLAVFGSYVRGDQRRGSDIDILVELAQSHHTFDNYMDLKFFLGRLAGGKIDLVTKDGVRAELKAAILREAVHV